ncbi:hypothetical protein [uncultured Nitrosomonas sp.]|uniref:hypothetical protein n=1 Tax=uncultured Nitrosomonas sp. TaxID=156424 RepID=UPI0025F1558F|nr:hypothetical protein [uncultured Nitrosomonas sp.]
MNLGESLYRIRRRASLVGMWIKLCTGHGLPFNETVNSENFMFCRSKLSCLPLLPWDCADLELSNLTIQDDKQIYVIPNSASQAISAHDLCWHKAPDSEHYWPLKFFARIPFAPGNPIGDIQLAWARSRLQNLFTFSLIGNLTDDLYIKRQVTRQMEKIMLSWISANPWLKGVNYISTMECALRLISICHAFDRVRNEKISPQTWQAIVYLVHSHAYFIRRRLCLFESSRYFRR